MEYGDDDDWDANELDALEEAAVNTYAATQQQRTQGLPIGRRTGLQEGTPPDSLVDVDLDALLKEKQKYEKLARDKQGELLILKSNIGRATAEHASALDNLHEVNRSTRNDLTSQLQAYKERVARLETDLQFQRQELKEAKLQGLHSIRLEQSRLLQNASPSNSNSRVFPDRAAFEKEDSREALRQTPSNAKKRKRLTRQTTGEHALDDFDLAEQLSQQAAYKQQPGVVDRDQSPMEVDPFPARPTSPQRADDVDVVDNVAEERQGVPSDKMSSPSTVASPAAPDRIMVYNELLGAAMSDGSCCITNLASVPSRSDAGSLSDKASLGQAILALLANQSPATTGESLTLNIARYVVDRLVMYKANTEVVLILIRLLRSTLSLFPKTISSDLVKDSAVESPRALLATLQDLTDPSLPFDLRQSAMLLVLDLVEAIELDNELCAAAQGQFRGTFYKTMLSTTQDLSLRILTLKILARLVGKNGTVQYSSELLDYTSINLDKDDFTPRDQLDLRVVVAQCLYCITTSQSGLEQIRKSRHVIPRIIRRISRELDDMQESAYPDRSVILIKMLVKLYYIVIKDENNATSEQHWRTVEIKAAHLTSMTRIVYAEDHDNFDNATQDLAMDLLELAVSPEEGNDIWEIMGGT